MKIALWITDPSFSTKFNPIQPQTCIKMHVEVNHPILIHITVFTPLSLSKVH